MNIASITTEYSQPTQNRKFKWNILLGERPSKKGDSPLPAGSFNLLVGTAGPSIGWEHLEFLMKESNFVGER